MSNVKIKANASGSADFTIEAPATDSALTLTLPSVAGELLTTTGDGSGLTGVGVDGLDSDYTSGTAVKIDSSGRVGIGTSSPSAPLHVFSNSGDGLRLDRNNTGAVGNQIAFRHSNAGTLTETAAINAISTANADTGTLAFYTKVSGGSNTERMRIDSSGNLKFNSGYGSAATAYGCRAWVNFNATGTPSIRGSGNVSSITDSSPDFIVNFTTAMVDTNYSAIGLSQGDVSDDDGAFIAVHDYTTSSVKFRSRNAPTHSAFDSPTVNVAIFR